MTEYRMAGGDKADADRISNYFDLANENGELLKWTIEILEGRTCTGEYPVNIGKITLNSSVVRGKNSKSPVNSKHNIDIKAIVSPCQEYIDLNPEKINGIEERTEKRRMREKEKELILIYPLHPKVPVFESLNDAFSSNVVPDLNRLFVP